MPTLNHKSGPRAKILAYIARNGLSTTADIMAGIGEPVRTKAQNNINAAAQDGLIVRKRDDITNLPGYDITDAGRAWLKANGRDPKPKAATKAAAAVCDTPAVCTESQTAAAVGESEGGEADASVDCPVMDSDCLGADGDCHEACEKPAAAPLTPEQREELSRLSVISDIRKAIGDTNGKIMMSDLVPAVGEINAARAAALERERDDLRTRLDAVGPKLLSAEQTLHLHGYSLNEHSGEWTAPAGHLESEPRLLRDTIETLREEAEGLTKERDDLRTRLDAVTQQSVKDIGLLTEKNENLHREIEHLRADLATRQQELERLNAENLALKTLDESMPGFGAKHQAEQIFNLNTDLKKTRGELAAALATIENMLPFDIERKPISGYIVRNPKKPGARLVTFKNPDNATRSAVRAVRGGARNAKVFALVEFGTATAGAVFNRAAK